MPWLPPSLQGIPAALQPVFKALTRQIRQIPKMSGWPSGAGNHLVLSGTMPTGGFEVDNRDLDLKMQAGFGSATTNALGRVTVTFREPFPNGLFIALATRASATNFVREIAIDTAVGQTDRTKVTFIFSDSAGANQATAGVVFCWMALGW